MLAPADFLKNISTIFKKKMLKFLLLNNYLSPGFDPPPVKIFLRASLVAFQSTSAIHAIFMKNVIWSFGKDCFLYKICIGTVRHNFNANRRRKCQLFGMI